MKLLFYKMSRGILIQQALHKLDHFVSSGQKVFYLARKVNTKTIVIINQISPLSLRLVKAFNSCNNRAEWRYCTFLCPVETL